VKRLLILIVVIVPLLGALEINPDYSFECAWNIPCQFYSGTRIADLNGDGLSEILYLYQEKDQYTLAAIDTFSNLLWEMQLEEAPYYMFSEDINNDGLREIFLLTSLVPSFEEMSTHTARWQVTCLNAEGIVLWTTYITGNSEWGGYLHDRYTMQFADVTGDGYEEIMVANIILDHEGNTLYEYDTNYTIIGYVDGEEARIIMEKETDPLIVGEEDYTAYCRIVTIYGDILWEKEFEELVYFAFLSIEGEKRLFCIQSNVISEVDLISLQEEPRIELDFDRIGEPFPLIFEVLDVNNDGRQEYVTAALDSHYFGNSAIFVYDTSFQLMWDYKDARFYPVVVDLDNDGICEFLMLYVIRFEYCASEPTFFRVLNHDKSARWTILFSDLVSIPTVIDIDADEDKELIFMMDFTPRVCGIEEGQVEFEVFGESGRYLYVFGPDGSIEKQFDVSSGSIAKIHDLDGDGDLDLLYYIFENEKRLCAYTNTRFEGPLDEIPAKEQLEEVDLGEIGLQRDFLLDPAMYYRYKRFDYFLKRPFEVPSSYHRNVIIILGMLAAAGFIFPCTLVRFLARSNEWEPKWEFRNVVLYLFLLVIPPVAVVYLSYKISKSSSELKKALGFTAITRKQAAISVVIGALLLGFGIITALIADLYGEPDLVTAILGKMGGTLVAAVSFVLITGSIAKEIVLSGYFYPLLRKKIGRKKGIIVTSISFAVLSIEFLLIPLLFIEAVIKMYAYERTHCIFVPLIIYVIYDLLIVIMVIH
jgi:membrane protease YdiL (CAAX protease family)